MLNRGVVLEQLGAFDAAVADYNAVLSVSPGDPAAWNNRGNARMGKGEYAGAAEDYSKAVSLAPASFSFAAANRSIALYAAGAMRDARARRGDAARGACGCVADVAAARRCAFAGERVEAERAMRALLRRYPDFADGAPPRRRCARRSRRDTRCGCAPATATALLRRASRRAAAPCC